MMPPLSKRRLDGILVERGYAPSSERAQSLIAAGLVEVDGRRAVSAGQLLSDRANIRALGRARPFASRAGGKLAGALDAFSIDCRDRVALDAGASTGGFTDVLLHRGVRRVYAVDVGYGQLDHRIASDPRVAVMDRTNLRSLDTLSGEAPSLVTLDLSFISLRRVMGRVVTLTASGADVVALFKPQFELPRNAVGKGGLVADDTAGEVAARDFLAWAVASFGCRAFGPVRSGVKGTKGNQEYLVHLVLPSVVTTMPEAGM